MSSSWFVRLFFLLWMICDPPCNHFVDAHFTVQCVQTGAGRIERPYATEPIRTWTRKRGMYSLGAKRFDSVYGNAMGAFWATKVAYESDWWNLFTNARGMERQDCPYYWSYKAGTDVQLCDHLDAKVKLRMSGVKQTDASGTIHNLAGWLHIEVSLVDPEDSIRLIYAQMYDEYLNAIGEFVTDPAEQCDASDPTEFISPSLYQYLPCSAIGTREIKGSQAIYMVNQDDYLDKSLKGSKYVPKEELNRGVHFTWRMNEYFCSRHERITPMIFIATTKNIDEYNSRTNFGTIPDPEFNALALLGDWKLYRKIPNYWLIPDWFGVADIKHPERGPLQCNNPVFNGTGFDEQLTGKAPWIRDKFKHTVLQEYFHVDVGYLAALYPGLNNDSYCELGCRACQQVPYWIENYAQFVGRCLWLRGKFTSPDHYQSCRGNASAPEFAGLSVNFTKFENYKDNLHAYRNGSCGVPCRAPESETDAIEISKLLNSTQTRSGGKGGGGITQSGRSKIAVERFWKGRKFHGVLCLVVTMFFMPVSNFVARYFKESFMKRQFHGVHIWYWVHCGASVGSLALLICGQIAVGEGIRSWGRNQSFYSVAHHSLGWTSIFGMIFMVILGKLRNAKKPWLKRIMVAHAVAGFATYFFNVILIGFSTFIPASPSLRRCGRDGLPTGISPTMYIAMAWAVLDGIFHGFLTILQMTADRTLMGVGRPTYFPIIPILSPLSHKDMKRSAFRKLLLSIYVILCSACTIAATFSVGFRYQPEGCTVGEMSCKAALGCTPVGLAMCKKLMYEDCTRDGRKFI